MTTLLVIVLVLVVAAAGGFLGTLLEAAAWLVAALAVVGAVIGFLLWRWLESFRSRT